MVNTLRGEIPVQVGEVVRVLCPTFAVLCAIESTTGKPLLALAEQCAAGQLSLEDIVKIVHAGIKHDPNNALSPETIGEALVGQGVAMALAPVSKFLSIALTGETLEKKPEGAWEPLF